MKNVIVDILKIVAPLSVAVIVFAQGLAINPSDVAGLFKGRPWMAVRSLLAVLALVPAAALAILLGLHADPAVAIGLAILVSCPPAPLMVSNAPNKGASAPFMAGLHLALSALAFVTVPAVLYVLSGALGFEAEVDLGSMGWILARTNLIPLALGLIVRHFAPAVADRLGPTLGKAGMMGLLVVVVFALTKFYPALLNMDPWSYLIIALVSVSALTIGHFAGPDDPRERAALAIECGVRHPALAIAIAAANFGPERALPVLVPCVLTFIAIATVYLSSSGRALATARKRVA
jgi:BASS family bile acid:Na+ symporter